ncbi:MAG: ribose 5-phosphate isomerase B [Candidatus Omnitrophota bacterium]
MKVIAIASDHAGFKLKEKLKLYLLKKYFLVKDFGTRSPERCDYPDFAAKLAEAVAKKKFSRGILICKSGIGNSIVANKFAGVRAALCYNPKAARLSREHNDSNVLVLGQAFVSFSAAKNILNLWLKTNFAGGRHQRRLNKIKKIEKALKLR